MQQTNTIYKDIVLIGGGHSHALVIKMWGMRPVAGVRLTLISAAVDTPYSGMLPGLVSGHYSFSQTHIDLAKLCMWAGVRFICATVRGIDTSSKSIALLNRPDIDYDLVAINTGSTPNIHRTAGAAQFATGVKPIAEFYRKWQQLKENLQHATRPLNIALVGAGAGGFELICAMQFAWSQLKEQTNNPLEHQFHWVISGSKVLGNHNLEVQKQALEKCKTAQIQVHFNFYVEEVTANLLIAKPIAPDSNFDEELKRQTLAVDKVIWCTAASAAPWPKAAGLNTDQQGFIAVNDYLQSTSDSRVFATGDVACQINHPSPKAGVFAVRQGPVLFKNLCAAILQRPLQLYRPQKSFLSILATGDRHAIASKSQFYCSGHWVWRWKDFIDLKFMAKLTEFSEKPPMQVQPVDPVLSGLITHPKTGQFSVFKHLYYLFKGQSKVAEEMRCGGCGAKVGSNVLSAALHKVTSDIRVHKRSDVIVGLESPDDAAIIDTGQRALAQSVDQFRSIIDDPYLFARIATNHALSDLHAMACEPQSALAIVAMPHAAETVQKRELYQLMYGIIEELNKAGCTLTGGHTSEAIELSLGLAVNGLVDRQTDSYAFTSKTGIRAGQQLIITKAIGSGVIMAAQMQLKANGQDVQSCIENMLLSNQTGASILKEHGCQTMTDVTGFGLMGHLIEMLRGTELDCLLSLSNIPLLNSAVTLSEQGIESSLFEKNFAARSFIINAEQWHDSPQYPLLFDPQTSGGLLAWVDADIAEQCKQALRDAGYPLATIIGEATINSVQNPATLSVDIPVEKNDPQPTIQPSIEIC